MWLSRYLLITDFQIENKLGIQNEHEKYCLFYKVLLKLALGIFIVATSRRLAALKWCKF